MTGGNLDTDGNDPLLFGVIDLASGGGTYTQFLKGSLDDVRIYDNALTASEVGQLAVPEPSKALLVIVGVGVAALRRRRSA